MDQIQQTIEPAKQFAKDSIRLVKRCTKPDRKGKYYLPSIINIVGNEHYFQPFHSLYGEF